MAVVKNRSKNNVLHVLKDINIEIKKSIEIMEIKSDIGEKISLSLLCDHGDKINSEIKYLSWFFQGLLDK